MFSSKSLPLIPGYNFNEKMGRQERYPRSSLLSVIKDSMTCLVEEHRSGFSHPFPWDPAISDKYPSHYPTKHHAELPAWLIQDKRILTFEAYFTDAEQSRKVKMNYFLEDGTIQVNEKETNNSGISQGMVISRRRIPFSRPSEKAFYELIDLNIGKTVELFGRQYHIYKCDKMTRQWLNRAGIPVPNPYDPPKLLVEHPRVPPKVSVHIPSKSEKVKQFLKFDGHVLRLFGYWDDRESEGGYLHQLKLHYYLSDDTMDVQEGSDVVVARGRLPKTLSGPPEPGATVPQSLLNVFTTGYLMGRMVKDSQNVGVSTQEYYTDGDLVPGTCINVYGRPVHITGCDAFTREFLRAKYGVEELKEIQLEEKKEQYSRRELPPWNGYGSYEDSAANCLSLALKPLSGLTFKTLVKNRSAQDSNILRFKAKIISDDANYRNRHFIVAHYLEDNTTSIFETADNHSGYDQRMFMGRKEAFKPFDPEFVTRKPSTYSKEDFWVGNVLHINKFDLLLTQADEFTIRFMEINSQEFPKSNLELILMKIGDKIRPVYKNFVGKYLLKEEGTISWEELTDALITLMGSDITLHEIQTVCRHFAIKYDSQADLTTDTLREICRNECRRLLYHGYDRLTEYLRLKDPTCSGYIPRCLAYSICRGAKLPIQQPLLNTVLDRLDGNKTGEINIDELLTFFDTEYKPLDSPTAPINMVHHFSQLNARPMLSSLVDCKRFVESLALEGQLQEDH